MKTCQTSINRMSFYLALREVWVWSQCSFLCRWCFQPFAPNSRLLPRKRGKTNLQKTWNFRRCDVDEVGDKSKNLTSEPAPDPYSALDSINFVCRQSWVTQFWVKISTKISLFYQTFRLSSNFEVLPRSKLLNNQIMVDFLASLINLSVIKLSSCQNRMIR